MKSTLFTETHREVMSDSFMTLQGDALLKVNVDQEQSVIARRGTVIATRGLIDFAELDNGDPESFSDLFSVSGDGSLVIGDAGTEIHLILLEEETINILGTRVVAFDSRLRYAVRETRSAGLPQGGFWRAQLSGAGFCALSSRGAPMLMRSHDGESLRTDLFSTVAWSSGLRFELKPSYAHEKKAQQERFYLSFSGDGWVLLQAGE